jgi:hypothetical protein
MNHVGQFSNSGEICAVAIGKPGGGPYTHCGLLYNSSQLNDNNSFFLHLGDPFHLYNEQENDAVINGKPWHGYLTTKSNFIWLPFVDIPVAILRLIRTKCIVIANANEALPYGVFHEEETSFDAHGKLILGRDSTGLTCSSFVKVVLKDSGVNIIDDVDWPDDREGDVDWLNWMITFYSDLFQKLRRNLDDLTTRIKDCNDRTELAKLKLLRSKYSAKRDTVGRTIRDLKNGTEDLVKRYRPEEVSACSFKSFSDFPIKFEYPASANRHGAGILGVQLLQVLP